MPRCQGLPDGPCPASRNDSRVRLGEGELMLCGECNKARFNMYLESKKDRSAVTPECDSREKAGSVTQTAVTEKSATARPSASTSHVTDTSTRSS